MRKTLVAALVAALCVTSGCASPVTPSLSGFTISAGKCTRDSDGEQVAMSYCDGGSGGNKLSPTSATISKLSGFTITAGRCIRDADGEEVALSYCEPE